MVSVRHLREHHAYQPKHRAGDAAPRQAPARGTAATAPADDVFEVDGAELTPLQRERLAAVERFVRDLAPRMPLHRLPEVVLDEDLGAASGRYDERTHRILIPRKMLEWDGKHARKILLHEMAHAWQNETGLLRWNLDQVGHYIDAPNDSLGKVLRNPLKIAQMTGYALQPSELHAELSRITRQILHASPPPPW